MAIVQCNFTITAAGNGGNLAGNGFGNQNNLNSGDVLQAVVHWAGQNPPSQLNGYFIFSPAGNAPPTQASPSPFVSGAKFVCITQQTAQKAANAPSYTFAGLTYGGGQGGKYELTFVAEDASTLPPTQWSDDPEFDTGN